MLSVLGWVLFPSMYLVSVLPEALGFSDDIKVVIALTFGVSGFILWIVSFLIGVVWLLQAKNIAVSLGAIILSVVPLGFLVLAYMVASKGGV